MKAFLLLFAFMIISGSSFQNIKDNDADSDLIVEKIIEENDFKAKKNDSGNSMISATLIRIERDFNIMNENSFEESFLPIGPDGRPDSNAPRFLFKKDYKDFVSQYNENKATEISPTIANKYRNLKLADMLRDKKNHIAYDYMEFSKPFFSHDQQTVYIEVNYHSGIYGEGTAYILRKNNMAWEIVQKLNIWIT